MLYRNMSANATNNSVSSLPTAPSSHLAYSYLLRVAFGIIALMAFLSNGLLCVVILRNRKMLKSAYNLLIFSLAVTDMLTGTNTIWNIDVIVLTRECESKKRVIAFGGQISLARWAVNPHRAINLCIINLFIHESAHRSLCFITT